MIRSRVPLHLSVCAAITLLANAAPLSRSAAQGPPPRRDPGTLVIRNVMFDSVRVEIRIGPSDTCEMNPQVGVRKLRKGRAWAVKSDRGVCWRRELSPGSSATNAWTEWSRRVVPARAEVRITV
jgi:hypothetical protein